MGIIRVVPVMLETASAFIEPNKTAPPATDPEITRHIFVDIIDISTFTERILVAWLRNVMGDFLGRSIQSIQGAGEETYPQNVIGFLIDRLNPAG